MVRLLEDAPGKKILSISLILICFFLLANPVAGQVTMNALGDIQQGTWLQLEFKAEVAGFTTDHPLEEFIPELANNLDAEVMQVDANHLEIRKYYSQADLEPKFLASGGKLTSYQHGVSESTAEEVKRILENKINTLGTKDAKVNILTGVNNVAQYIRVELAGVDMKQAQEIVGKQGKFEIRVQTTGNLTEHVLYGDTITSVQKSSQEPAGSDNWGVGFTLSENGADAFRAAAIKYGATTDPAKHNLIMLLDNSTVYSAPLSEDLAGKLQSETIRQLYASTGTGRSGTQQATILEIHLRGGALPVDVTIAGSGDVSAPPEDRYNIVAIPAVILVLVIIAGVGIMQYRKQGKKTGGKDGQPVPAESEQVVCSRCGNRDNSDSRYCMVCGNPLDTNPATGIKPDIGRDSFDGGFQGKHR
jgi:preprotein translocase subunit SecD